MKHEELSKRIEALQDKMKLSRQNGAFQNLQMQMSEVKQLVKDREEIDAKMSTLDLARKKDDDYRAAAGYEASYGECLESFDSRVEKLESLLEEFSELAASENFDFTRCVRPDGSVYGTRGKCKKGSETSAPVKEVKVSSKALRLSVREKSSHLNEVRKQLSAGEKKFRAMVKEAKKNPSPEKKEELKLAQKALAQKQREVARAEREAEKALRQWSSARKKEERAKMNPAQLQSERKLDRIIRERG